MQIPFLKTDPAKKLRRDIDAAREKRKQNNLAGQLAAAESEVIECREAPVRLARDGADPAALDLAEKRLRAAEHRANITLPRAIADEDNDITKLEQQLAKLAVAAQRAESSDWCVARRGDAEEFRTKKIPGFFDDLVRFTDLVSPIVTDASAVGHFGRAARAELIPALELVASILDAHARAVRSGDAPATLPTPAPAPIPLRRAPEEEAIWLIKPVAFENGGQVVVRDLNQFIRLPPALVTKAIDIGAGVCVGDPRAGKRVSSWRQWYAPGPLPSLDHCALLDSAAEAAAAKEKQKATPHTEVVRHSAHSLFEPLDRGPAFVIRTSGPNSTPEGGSGQ
jgi:hypothetical protein